MQRQHRHHMAGDDLVDQLPVVIEGLQAELAGRRLDA
jgi:hypothetical protein